MKTNISRIVEGNKDKYKLENVQTLHEQTSQKDKDIYLALALDGYKTNPTQDGANKITSLLGIGADPFMRSFVDNPYVELETAGKFLEDMDQEDKFGIKGILKNIEAETLELHKNLNFRDSMEMISACGVMGGGICFVGVWFSMLAMGFGDPESGFVLDETTLYVCIGAVFACTLIGLIIGVREAKKYQKVPGDVVYNPTYADLKLQTAIEQQ